MKMFEEKREVVGCVLMARFPPSDVAGSDESPELPGLAASEAKQVLYVCTCTVCTSSKTKKNKKAKTTNHNSNWHVYNLPSG